MQQDTENRIRIVIVEDEDLYRDMMATSLGWQPGIEVLGQFATAEMALREIPTLRPDVVVVDILLGGSMNGIQLGLRLREVLPRVGICLLSNSLSPAILRSIPEDELSGWSYLHKKAVGDLETLRRAILGTANGLVVLDPAVPHPNQNPMLHLLTPRQMDVLRLIAQGYSNEAIAERLALAEKTVANYINSLYQRIGIDAAAPEIQPRVKAALYYLNNVAFAE